VKDQLFDALKSNTADYAEIRVEVEERTSLAYRGKEVESSTRSSFVGGLARACTRGGWGVVTFDSLDNLNERVAEACRCAALVGREETQLADTEPVDRECPAELEQDFRGVGLEEKLKIIGDYNQILLSASPKIESTNVTYADAFRTVYFASSRGTYFMEERPRAICVLGATAREGSLVQQSHDSVSSNRSFGAVLGLEGMAEQVGQRAAALLTAPKVDGGPHTVILDPKLAGVFIHEAFGHLSEADFIYETPQMRSLMEVGREVGVKEFNVYDDGSLGGYGGSLHFDDEGTPTSRTCLIQGGVLAGHLHSLETSAKMGAAPTGNARALSRHYAPIVRMTNTYIDQGNLPVAELFAGVDDGILCCDMFGGQTMLEMFTFSAAYGYRIRKGQVGELLRDITLSGNVFETLKAIDGIADDLYICQGAGGCGKNGQSPLPVSFGSPHIRIRDVVIGGS
jgi:TldD protein